MWLADRLANLVSGLGTAKDKSAGAAYVFAPLSVEQIVAAYRSDWIARKVIDVPVMDMVRAGRNWQAADPQIEKLEAEERRLGYWQKVARALRLSRLYGGAAIIQGADTRLPSEPLEPDRIEAGGLEYLHVVSRHDLTTGELERDPAATDWGAPTYYELSGRDGPVRLHPSRVIRFGGVETPDRTLSEGWGDSVLQILDEAIKNAGLAAGGIAGLIAEAKVDVFKIKGLTQNVGDPLYRARMLERFSLANTAKSLQNALIMDAEEEYQQKQVSFGALPDVLRLYLQVAAGAADIPATRLLGIAPAGLNATGDSDTRNYYDRLSAEQEMTLRPTLAPLDDLLIRSALGSRPSEVHYTFAPLWQIGESERSEIRRRDAETARIYVDSGLVPLPALAKVVQNQLVEQAAYPGLESALAESEATVGLSTEMFRALLSAWQSGGAPKSVLFDRLKAAGLLPNGMTLESFEEEIAADKALGTEGEFGELEAREPPREPAPDLQSEAA